MEDNISFFEDIFELSSDAFFVHDLKGKILKVNKAACLQSGYSRKELLKKNIFKLDRKIPKKIILNLISDILKKNFIEYEIDSTRKNSKKRLFVKVVSKLVLFEGKKVVLSVSRDITSLKILNEKIKIEGSKFRNLVKNSVPIVFLIGLDGKFIVSEGKSLASLGLKPGEAVGKSVFEMYKDYPRITNAVKKTLKGESISDVIDVKGVIFQIFYAPYHDKDENIEGLVGMAIDITDKKKIENDLKQKNENLTSTEYLNNILIKSTGQMTYNLDLKSEKIIWKGAMFEVTGYKEFKANITDWKNMIHKKDLKKVNNILNESIKTGKDFSMVYLFKQIDGSYVPVLDNGVMVKDDKGNMARRLGVMRNISKEVEKNQALEDKLKSLEIFSNIAINRELKMVELKEKIEALEEKLKKKKNSK